MYSITIGLDPDIVDLGSFSLNWHGILTVLAVIAGFAAIVYFIRKDGWKAEEVFTPVICAIIGGIIFSRLFHVVDKWEIYSQAPLEIITKFWYGASIYGAIIGGAIGAAIYAKIAGWSWTRLGRLADVAAPGCILGQAVGRIGCILNGDAYGTATGLPWGFEYTHINHLQSTRTSPYVGHPYPVYEIFWDLAIFAILVIFRKKLKPPIIPYLLYMTLYALGRFVLSFWRVNDEYLWGLQQVQVIGLFIVIIFVPIMVYLIVTRKKYEGFI